MAKTPRVSLFVSTRTSTFRGMLEGIRAYCRQGASWSFFLNSDHSGKLAASAVKGFDGIIAAVADMPFARRLLATGLPCVNVSAALAEPPLPTVRCDDRAIGRLAAEHFLRRGFRNFGFVSSWRGAFSLWRHEAFSGAVRKAGFECHLHNSDPSGSRKRAQVRLARWLSRLPKPVAVMAANDSLGEPVLEVCRTAGLTVPDEVAVLGVGNDLPRCHFCCPPLSSIPIGAERIGYEAARLLHRLMAGHRPPPRPLAVPPMEVVCRQSSDTLAVDDPHVAKAARFIAEHACDPIRVRDVLAEVKGSRRSLEQHFQRALGRSLHEEIRQVQLDRAKRLLLETNMPAGKVARACGLGGAPEISRIFRREVGMSPGEYRRQFQP